MQKSASILLRHQIRTFQALRNTTYRSFSTSNDNSLSGRRVFSSVPPVVAVYNDEEAFEEDVKVAFQQQQQQQAAAVAKKKSSKSVPHSNSCAPVVLHQLNDIQKVTRPSAQLLPDGKKKHNANVAIVNQETKELTSPSYILFAGDTNIPVTSVLKIVTPGDDVPSGTWPLFRLLVRISLLSFFRHGERERREEENKVHFTSCFLVTFFRITFDFSKIPLVSLCCTQGEGTGRNVRYFLTP